MGSEHPPESNTRCFSHSSFILNFENISFSFQMVLDFLQWSYYNQMVLLSLFPLKIWRPSSGTLRYRLVSITKYYAPVAGFHFVDAFHFDRIQKGDVYGFYFPGDSIIPYDLSPQCRQRGVHVRAVTPVDIGAYQSFVYDYRVKCYIYSVAVVTSSGEYKSLLYSYGCENFSKVL